jgi:heat shock protein HslJ
MMTQSRVGSAWWGIACTALIVFAAAGLAGCGGDEAGPAALDGTRWRLVDWSFTAFPPTDFTTTAAFEDGQISGVAAVNGHGASYTTGPDGAFSVADIVATEMAGSRRAMQAEAACFELLGSAASYAHDGDTLTLHGADGSAALVFVAM